MNILVTINKQCVKQLNILLNSIQMSNKNKKFDIYIMHKNLDENDFEKIYKNINRENIKMHDIKIKKSVIDSFPVYEDRYPVEIYFRIFASKYLPKNIDRVLYLDVDTLVINSLDELYNMDFEENLFIAATHVKKVMHKLNEMRLGIQENSPYINTGVLLMNLQALRGIDVEHQVIDFVKNNKRKLMLPDQDILSTIYGDKIKLVDGLKYNLGDRNLNAYNMSNLNNKIGLKWICKNTVIIHYFGRNKPWNEGYIGKLGCFYKKIEEKIYMDSKKKKVLILSCGTGGGHNSAAKAVQEELRAEGIQADFIEYLEITNPNLKDKVNNLYLKSTKGNGKIFKNVYGLGEIYQKTKLKSPVYMLNSLNKNKLYNYIKSNNYGYVVTTHLFAAQALTAIKKEHRIHFMQIATDYVSIPFWEETNPDYFIIPCDELEKDFISKGIKKNKLKPLGIPVFKGFRETKSKEECKKELGLDINKQYVLIVNGSMGFGNVQDLTKELVKEIKDVTFIVSCGTNKKLVENLKDTYKDNERVIVLSYTSEINKYMASSEVVLSKPGGLTTTEVATMRKPLVHIMPIPGCENDNADFFASRKMSIKCESIKEIIESTKKLVKDKKMQEEIIENQKKYIRKDTCEEISKIIKSEFGK